MKARFIGDPNDNCSGADTITVYDHEFVKGKWRTVSNAKFATHSHFEFDGDEDGKPDLDEDELRKALDELGVKYHPRTGPAKLAAMLEEATAPPSEGEEEGA